MMKVFYRCACMDADIAVECRFRGDDEDIGSWLLGSVAEAVSEDHRVRSPLCTRTKMKHLKIPMPENAPFIGGEPELQS